MKRILTHRTEIMGLAILWIMLFHSAVNLPDEMPLLRMIKEAGYAGVDVFFLLSGMVLSLGARGGIDLGRFYPRRLLRIYPIFFVYAMVACLLSVADHTFKVESAIFRFLGLDFLISGSLSAWFVPAILICYLFFPFYHRLSERLGFWVAFFGASLITIALCCLMVGTRLDHLLIFAIRIPVFLFGVVIGHQFHGAHGAGGRWSPRSLLDSLPFNLLLLAAASAALLFLLRTHELSNLWRTGLWWYPTIVMAYPLTYVVSLLLQKAQGLVPALLSGLRFFGERSFELYLVHTVIFKLGDRYLFHTFHVRENVFRIPEHLLYVAVSLVISIVLGDAIEAAKSKLLGRRYPWLTEARR